MIEGESDTAEGIVQINRSRRAVPIVNTFSE